MKHSECFASHWRTGYSEILENTSALLTSSAVESASEYSRNKVLNALGSMCEMQWFHIPVSIDLSDPTLLGKGECVLSNGESRWEGNMGLQRKDWWGVQFHSSGFVGSVRFVCLFDSQYWGKSPVPWADLCVVCTKCFHSLILVGLNHRIINKRAVT